jgi:hypothetical protein
MSTHEAEVRTLASLGSWSARDLLGVERGGAYPSATDEELADRFFLGDVAMVTALRNGYTG